MFCPLGFSKFSLQRQVAHPSTRCLSCAPRWSISCLLRLHGHSASPAGLQITMQMKRKEHILGPMCVLGAHMAPLLLAPRGSQQAKLGIHTIAFSWFLRPGSQAQASNHVFLRQGSKWEQGMVHRLWDQQPRESVDQSAGAPAPALGRRHFGACGSGCPDPTRFSVRVEMLSLFITGWHQW